MTPRDPCIVSETMRRVRSRDTGPEKVLRRALWGRGLRYRLYYKRLPGNPDVVFPGPKVAVFIDGDFWHGNQWRLRRLSSLEAQFEGSPRADYWIPKIKRNILRDADTTRRLEYDGWHVIRIWESDLKHDLEGWARKIADAVTSRRSEAS